MTNLGLILNLHYPDQTSRQIYTRCKCRTLLKIAWRRLYTNSIQRPIVWTCLTTFPCCIQTYREMMLKIFWKWLILLLADLNVNKEKIQNEIIKVSAIKYFLVRVTTMYRPPAPTASTTSILTCASSKNFTVTRAGVEWNRIWHQLVITSRQLCILIITTPS